MKINKIIPEATVEETVKGITFTVGSTVADVKINGPQLSRNEKVDITSVLTKKQQTALRDSLIKIIAAATGVEPAELVADELFPKNQEL